MGRFLPGDVVLAPVRLRKGSQKKVRPVVVVSILPDGFLLVCPVSSRAPRDVPSLLLALADFREGGLDLCEESHILFTMPLSVGPGDVIGKKGTLSDAVLKDIIGKGNFR